VSTPLNFDPLCGLLFDDPYGIGYRQANLGVYEIAFDGSGTIGQHLAIAYAGVMATHIQWGALSEAWSSLLKEHDLKYFKMAEAETFYGEFQRKYTEWGDKRNEIKDALLLELATLAKRYDFRIAGCAGGMRHFSGDEKTAKKKLKLFQGAILALLTGTPFTDSTLEHRVMLISDIEQDVEHDYRRWIDSLRKEDYKSASRIMGIAFMDDKFVQALQLADMVAFLARQEAERFIMGNPDSEVNPLYTLLMLGSNVTAGPIAEDKFFDGLRD